MLSLLYMMKHSDELEAGIPLTSSREQDIPFMELEWPVGSGLLMIDDLTNRPPPRYIKVGFSFTGRIHLLRNGYRSV